MFISLNAKKDIDRFRKRGVVKFLILNLLHKKFSLYIHSLGNLSIFYQTSSFVKLGAEYVSNKKTWIIKILLVLFKNQFLFFENFLL